MGTARSLRRRIVPAALELALVQAAKPARWAKYAHAGARRRGIVVALGYRITRELARSTTREGSG
jgi:hypothetical protein